MPRAFRSIRTSASRTRCRVRLCGCAGARGARDTVFARSWQLVADLGRVRIPGRCTRFRSSRRARGTARADPRSRGPSALSVERVHAPRHVRGRGEASSRCCGAATTAPFGLDGRFQFMPEFEAAAGFPSAADDLPRVPFGVWDRSCSPRSSRGAARGGAARSWSVAASCRCRRGLRCGTFARLPGARQLALYVDNYLKASTFLRSPRAERGHRLRQYRTELSSWCNLQVGVQRRPDTFDLPDAHPDHGQRIAAYYFWIFRTPCSTSTVGRFRERGQAARGGPHQGVVRSYVWTLRARTAAPAPPSIA